jgi:uncharacterized protein YodC (DUF2158 family)
LAEQFFEAGDVVRLKSNGPKMTVTGELSNGRISTTWFAGAKLEHGSFPPEVLEHVLPTEGSPPGE